MSEEQNQDQQQKQEASDKELNFRRLEQEREKEREARMKAEFEAQKLREEFEQIKASMVPPEKDPLDDDDFDPDLRDRLMKVREKDKKYFEKQAKEITRQTLKEERERDRKENYLNYLKRDFPDIEQVCNKDSLEGLTKNYPAFAQSLQYVSDPYEKGKIVYEFLKNQSPKKEESTIQDKVKQNQSNPYYSPGTSQGPSGFDFDLRSPEARHMAYQKLKQAQKRPIGG